MNFPHFGRQDFTVCPDKGDPNMHTPHTLPHPKKGTPTSEWGEGVLEANPATKFLH